MSIVSSIVKNIVNPIVSNIIVGEPTGFDPVTALFGNNEVGALFDPSDMSTLFQDAAGTIPVTAAGQPVGLILDKSGNGNHASQSIADRRPLLQESGGLWSLKFDAVDDLVQTGLAFFGNVQSIFCGAGYPTSVAGWNHSFYAASGNQDGTNDAFDGNSYTDNAPYLWRTGYPGIDNFNSGPPIPPAPATSTFTAIRSSGTDIKLYVLGQLGQTINTVSADFVEPNYLTLGRHRNSAQFFGGNIYALSISGGLYDQATVDSMNQWVADRTGVLITLYPNPQLFGGSTITADIYATFPTNHVATPFAANPADASYTSGNPAYLFQGTGNSRFALGVNVNTATNRGVTLPGGRKYRFSAEVQLINSDGLETRLINVAALAGGAVLLVDGATKVPDGTWQSVYIDFSIPDGAANCQLRHGIGMFNAVTPVGATQQTRNLSLVDIGAL